jgi:hypothetical protein
MSWIFEFQAPVGSRILNSRFIGVTNYYGDLWWSHEHKKWLPLFEVGNEGASNFADCRSFKAFKKHLKRHPELKEADFVVLVSRFIGHNIAARWEETDER